MHLSQNSNNNSNPTPASAQVDQELDLHPNEGEETADKFFSFRTALTQLGESNEANLNPADFTDEPSSQAPQIESQERHDQPNHSDSATTTLSLSEIEAAFAHPRDEQTFDYLHGGMGMHYLNAAVLAQNLPMNTLMERHRNIRQLGAVPHQVSSLLLLEPSDLARALEGLQLSVKLPDSFSTPPQANPNSGTEKIKTSETGISNPEQAQTEPGFNFEFF